MTARPEGERSALVTGVACFLIWGLLPLLLRAADNAGASAWEVVSWRTVWAVPFALLLVAATGRLQPMRTVLSQKHALPLLILSASLIGSNWTIYVAAVEANHTLQASFGYYINPLLNMAAGALLFRERIDRLSWAAIGLAMVGVVMQAVAIGGLPWISLTLACSFCLYGIVRKKVPVDAQTGLFVECLLLMWPAIAYVIWLAPTGPMVFGRTFEASALLIGSGLATVIPLAMFAYSARRLSMTTMGFLQFIGPTVQFCVGVFAFGEQLTNLRLLSFAFIWAGAGLFVGASVWRAQRRPSVV
jgi:chloramphenicol-sensitive protein RarD